MLRRIAFPNTLEEGNAPPSTSVGRSLLSACVGRRPHRVCVGRRPHGFRVGRRLLAVCVIAAVLLAGCADEAPQSGDPQATGVDTVAGANDDAPRAATTPGTAPNDAPESGGESADGETFEAPGVRLPPIDEANDDPSFLSYRMHLIEAVGARDTTVLFESMADDVTISFGTEDGKSGFREMWRPSHADSEVWKILARVLGGGGLLEETEAGRRFRAPYYFAAFPGERFDAFQHGVIVGDAVPVRQEASSTAPAIDTLSYDIVSVPNFKPYEDGPIEWVRVQLERDRFGYVEEPLVRSPVGYRAVFQERDGVWLMTALVAGD